MKLNELKGNDGAKHSRKRLGRGPGSGLGKTSGKGHKGQKARSGGNVRPQFEGGQTPLFRRVPKRGFTNRFRKEYAIINVEDLNVFEENAVVTPELLLEMRIVRKEMCGIKVLGEGTLEKKLTIKAHKFSKVATQKINSAGGKIEVI